MRSRDALRVLPALVALALPAVAAVPDPPPPRSAQPGCPPLMTGISADSLGDLLRDSGYRAEIRKVPRTGAPYIVTGFSGRKIVIGFYECADERCGAIQYRLTYRKNKNLTPAVVADWNMKKRYAKAYLDDDGDLIFDWDVDLSGGVSPNVLRRSIERFEALVGEFDKFIR